MTKPAQWELGTLRRYVLTWLVCVLSVAVQLKFGEVQYLEIILACDLILVFAIFALDGFRMVVFEPLFRLGRNYVIFLCLVFLLALLALQGNFYAYHYTFLKRPLLVTLSRMAELFIDAFYMLYLASLFRADQKLCRFGARVYYWMGVAGAAYSIISFPLNYFLGMELGTYNDAHRMRGFGNEAGPYGTYLLSVMVLTVAMHHRQWIGRKQMIASLALFGFCLVGAQSKGAFFALVTLSILHQLWAYKGWRRVSLLVGVTAALAVAAVVLDIPKQVNVYVRASKEYQQLSNIRWGDGNYVAGRISGAFLAPRMMAAHPLIGIGWGNYPLVRDDPEYRQGTAYSLLDFDSPSLGAIDYMVDFGFPLWFYMTWVLVLPAYLLYRARADPWLVSLAMMQPIANWFGAHLNIIYPWVAVAFALGMGFARKRSEGDVPLSDPVPSQHPPLPTAAESA